MTTQRLESDPTTWDVLIADYETRATTTQVEIDAYFVIEETVTTDGTAFLAEWTPAREIEDQDRFVNINIIFCIGGDHCSYIANIFQIVFQYNFNIVRIPCIANIAIIFPILPICCQNFYNFFFNIAFWQYCLFMHIDQT